MDQRHYNGAYWNLSGLFILIRPEIKYFISTSTSERFLCQEGDRSRRDSDTRTHEARVARELVQLRRGELLLDLEADG